MNKIKLIFLIFIISSCTPFLTSTQLNEDVNFNMVFIPHKSYLQMDLENQSRLGKSLLKDDLYVIISEDANKIYIYPFYNSSPYMGGMGFYIKTTSKDESGFIGSIYDEDEERIGYVCIQNKKSIDLVINLEKKVDSKITKLEISAYCKDEEEVGEINFYDSVLLQSF